MADPAKWGLCATVKTDAQSLLEFCAYHLEAGAHRLFLYLDAPCPDARSHLKAHPKIRVTDCDTAFWSKRKNGRPEKHQLRQTANATRAYRRQAGGVEWLAHIDADEFLWSAQPLGSLLAALPEEALCARVRPVESLAGPGEAFKALPPAGAERQAVLARLYPRFGMLTKAGFLSHTNGKLFVRCGLDGLRFKIHNAYLAGIENPCLVELDGGELCHVHARDWESWLAHYRYRLENGSYRSDLAPNRPRSDGGQTLHEVLKAIESRAGTTGLRAFYDELCADTPGHRAKLEAEGLLRIRPLRLDELRRKHFPESG